MSRATARAGHVEATKALVNEAEAHDGAKSNFDVIRSTDGGIQIEINHYHDI